MTIHDARRGLSISADTLPHDLIVRPSAAPMADTSRHVPTRFTIKRAIGWLIVVTIVYLAAVAGVRVRHELWQRTGEVRFQGDINNGFNWGKKADHLGYFNVYDEMGTPAPGKEAVDYGPLRLGVMSAWVQWLKPRYADLSERETGDTSAAYHAPLLQFNLALESAAAALAWLLTTHLIRRARGQGSIDFSPESPWLPAGVFNGLVAGIVLWFNPLVIWNAHAWPQWDIWPVPFFLLAVYCGCRRWWLLGGLVIGAGSLLKGQTLVVAWTIPLWALCLGDWRGALRFVFGALCSIGLGGAVWELSIYMPGEHGFDRAVSNHEPIRRLNWPAVAWVVASLVSALALPRRFSPTVICVALGMSLLSTLYLFGGSPHWLESGFGMGTWHFPEMYMGPTSNLPAILHDVYHFDNIQYVCFSIDAPQWLHLASPRIDVTIHTVMLAIYFPLCAFCAVFAAVNDRRRDPRLAIAIFTPWLLFYLLPLQIHERYVLYFSACSAVLIAAGVGWMLLGVIITLVGLAITLHQVLICSGVPPANAWWPTPLFWRDVYNVVAPTHPGIAWLLLLAAAILLYSIVPPRAGRKQAV